MVEVGCFLYGSQNYGLDTPESDKDYKVILCPEFEDVYNYRKVESSDVPEKYDREHYSAMGFTRFHELIKKGNPNCIEMLFSVEEHSENWSFFNYLDTAAKLYELGYLAFVWDSFYSAVKGLALNTIKRNGVNNKSISRAYYWYGITVHEAIKKEFIVDEITFRYDRLSVFQGIAIDIRNNKPSDILLDLYSKYIPMWFANNEKTFSDKAKESIALMDKATAEEIDETIKTLDNIAKKIFAESIESGLKEAL